MPRQNILAFSAVWAGLLVRTLAAPHVGGADRFPDLRGGNLFFGLGCASCHGKGWQTGPSLTDLPKRINHDWLVDFLEQPEHERMPALFDSIPEGKLRKAAIADIAAWLGTLRGELKFTPPRHANAERGSVLYREIGCMACHAPGGTPLPDLANKTSLVPLAHFISSTLEYRPFGQMPQVPMTAQEGVDIAAHLIGFRSSDPREAVPIKPWPAADANSVARGTRTSLVRASTATRTA